MAFTFKSKVKQELQELEHLSQLMEQTGLGNPVSKDLTEKPRKTTKRKPNKTEKIPGTTPSAMRAAETTVNELKMKLLHNQSHKLELEILDKKLQLQKLGQTLINFVMDLDPKFPDIMSDIRSCLSTLHEECSTRQRQRYYDRDQGFFKFHLPNTP